MMADEYVQIEGGVCAAKGFLANGVHCGLRRNRTKPDLMLLYSEVSCKAAAVYTQNKVKGSAIGVTRAHIANGTAQAVIVNSGNANCCNLDGTEKAEKMCVLAAQALSIDPMDVVVSSTGIIGEVLPIEPIETAMQELSEGLSETGNDKAARAILTTDTCQKESAVAFQIAETTCHIGGMAKGSGMIHPNMATMLCFITTDVAISAELLRKALQAVTKDTFNMISVDGDTSTNDMVLVMASGLSGNAMISDENSAEYAVFRGGLYRVMEHLSREIARDGEGASKLLTCRITGAQDKDNAKKMAKSVITSSLFKSAMFGEDPNWGRILCAVGYAGAEMNADQLRIDLQSQAGAVQVCENGRGVPFDTEYAAKILAEKEVTVAISLADGDAAATAWGCDLTYDYVKINADYHT